MIINIDACRVGNEIKMFAYGVMDGDEAVRDQNHAKQVLDQLVGDGSVIQSADPRDIPGAVCWFRIWIAITRTHRDWARYSCDYRRFDGCPACVSEDAMPIYYEVKRVIRDARRDLAARKAAAK